jgi:hypothetical protein
MLVAITRLEQVAAQVMGCELEDVTEERYDSYGLKVYSYAGLEYAIGSDEEATEAANEYIKQSLWSFNASFILSHSKAGYNAEVEKALKEMQAKLCESANELVRAIIEDMDAFIEDAVSSDGRGTFLSSYDSSEVEVVIDNEYFYAYRLN